MVVIEFIDTGTGGGGLGFGFGSHGHAVTDVTVPETAHHVHDRPRVAHLIKR